MLEPAAAIGLAASIVQLFNFVKDILGNSHKIYASANGLLVENTDLETICTRLEALCLDIQKHTPEVPSLTSAREPSEADSQLQALTGEARARAKELIQVLESLKTTSKGSAWESVRKALASAAKSKDLELLEDRLARVRGEIDSALLVTLRQSIEQLQTKQHTNAQETRTHLDVLAKSLEGNRQLLQQVRQAQSTSTTLGPRDIPYYLPSELLSTTVEHRKEAFSNSCKSQILAQIEFEDMLDRHEAIPEAHRRTFEWLFQGNNGPGDNIHEVRPYPEMELSASHTPPPHGDPIVWRDFGRWLESDEKLYWITGKPGAGKSTLMKFLQHDPRTYRLAQRWATRLSNRNGSTASSSEISSSQLHMASFFFWIAGSDLQKSEEGLRRSLLYQLLVKDPNQIPELYPKRMQRYELFGGDSREFADSEHKRTLETLFQQRAYPILLFIDGLDEINGNTTELAKLIKRWSLLPHVKICVASRPWTVFECAFESMPTLQIEWLTRQDIVYYVNDNFNASRRFVEMRQHMEREAEELLHEVANKASGVFLWVYVVVASLLEGLTDGDSIADLRQRLRELPVELEELFDRILDRVNPDYAAQASEIFQFLRACPEKSTLIGMYHAQLPLEDAIAAEIGIYAPGRAQYFSTVMRRRLYSRCKCFIETDGRYTHASKLRYLHRTAMDYLYQPKVWQKIVSKQPSFNIGQARSTWRLMYTKKYRFSTEECYEQLGTLMHNPDILQINPVAMRVNFLDEVNKIGEMVLGDDLSPGSSRQVSKSWLSRLRSHMEKQNAKVPPAVCTLQDPLDMFNMARASGYDWYVSAKVPANKSLPLSSKKRKNTETAPGRKIRLMLKDFRSTVSK
jgi:hypothetical protein